MRNKGHWLDRLLFFTVSLAAAVHLLAAAPVVAQPTIKSASVTIPVGRLTTTEARQVFDNAGTNPRFTRALFPTMTYVAEGAVSSGRLYVEIKSAAELSALASPPDSPFTVTVEVTMTNDEGHTATGTLTFEITYVRAATSGTTPEPPVQPSLTSRPAAVNTPPGIVVSVAVDVFDNAGTNPRFTGAVFSTMDYYNPAWTGLSIDPSDYRLFVQAKTANQLNALDSPPPSPFTVTAEVTMTNDEGQTASGTLTFQTVYDRAPAGQ